MTVDVTNTGSVAGDEVVQLYVHQRAGSDSRPLRELKGFTLVTPQAGDKLVCLRNDPAKGLLNGSLWKVMTSSRETVKPGINLLVSPEDTSRLDLAFFTMNGVISVTFFAFVLADVVV